MVCAVTAADLASAEDIAAATTPAAFGLVKDELLQKLGGTLHYIISLKEFNR